MVQKLILVKFLNKINISVYSIIIIFLSLISGLFKEFIVISMIILFHEFGHFIFLYKYKWNIKEIKIYPFGGVCTLDEKIDKPLKEERCKYKIDKTCGVCVKRCEVEALTYEGFDRFKCSNNCKKNLEIFGVDVCGKCVVELPCSYRNPII